MEKHVMMREVYQQQTQTVCHVVNDVAYSVVVRREAEIVAMGKPSSLRQIQSLQIYQNVPLINVVPAPPEKNIMEDEQPTRKRSQPERPNPLPPRKRLKVHTLPQAQPPVETLRLETKVQQQLPQPAQRTPPVRVRKLEWEPLDSVEPALR